MTPAKVQTEKPKKVERGIASEIVGYAVIAGLAVGGILAFAIGCIFNAADGVKKGLGDEEKAKEGSAGEKAVPVQGHHTATHKPSESVPAVPPGEHAGDDIEHDEGAEVEKEQNDEAAT